MYVCLCNAITDADIRRHVADGLHDFESLRDHTGCSGCCGSCEDVAREVFAGALEAEPRPFLSVVAMPRAA